MKKIIPVFYSEYGRYIARFRAIPLYIDGLRPVERRILLGLNQVAKSKLVKSARVVGHVIGLYHPHGDQSAYETMVEMVKHGLAVGEGNWGSDGIEPDRAAAMRYTEVKSQKWVDTLAFEYCKPEYVPWESLESDPEPVFLPSPIALGLIGDGVITGIAFYTTSIPRYKFNDLKTRLIWLLEQQPGEISSFNIDEIDCDEKQFGPLIKPNIKGCQTIESEKNAYYKLLLRGYGALRIVPTGDIDSKKKVIRIKGKSPLRNGFKILTRKCDGLDKNGKPLKSGKIDAYVKDLSKTDIDIAVYPEKPRLQDLNQLATDVWNIISPNVTFNCQFCDQDGKLFQFGIDRILLSSYHAWKDAVLNKKVWDVYKLYEKYYEAHIIHYIRQIDFDKLKDVNQVVNILMSQNLPPVECEEYSNKTWNKNQKEITEKRIREVCANKSIKQLVEVAIDFTKIISDIKDAKKLVGTNDKDCLSYIKNIK